eukprot:3641175-Pleurochrysis_carterae.AAC.1
MCWVYRGEHAVPDTETNAEAANFQVAKVGDVLIDDIFAEVTLLGRNQDGSFTVRKVNGDIVDRTTGRLRIKMAILNEQPCTIPAFLEAAANGKAEVAPGDKVGPKHGSVGESEHGNSAAEEDEGNSDEGECDGKEDVDEKPAEGAKPHFVAESTEKCDSGVNGVSTTDDGKSEEVEAKKFAHDADDDSGVETSGV